MTGFIDRPAGVSDTAASSWTALTASSLSKRRGDHQQFATLVPPDGDAYLRVQRTNVGGGSHLDLHVDEVDEVDEVVLHTMDVGAEVDRLPGAPPRLRSPAGLDCCVVAHHGESVRPFPVRSHSGVLCLFDQLCIDIPACCFAPECEFWSRLTGWKQRASSVHSEFLYLVRPPWTPLRLPLQRRGDSSGPARAHLDIACDDVPRLVADHKRLGGTVLGVFEHWTAMNDPTGEPYCITGRDPLTGSLS